MRLPTIVCVMLCCGCSLLSDRPLHSLLADAQQSWDHGDLPRAWTLSLRGERLSDYSSEPAWKWRFRLLQSEVEINRHAWTKAAQLLQPNLPQSLAKTDIAARRQIDQGVTEAWMGNFVAAQKHFDAAAELCSLPGIQSLLGELKRREGLLAYLRNRPLEAEQFSRQAVTFARQNHQPFLEANAMSFLGAIFANTRQWGLATDWLQPATSLARSLSVKTLLEADLGNLGWCFYNLGDLESALISLTEAETLAAEIGLPDERRRWLTNIGLIYGDRDQFSTAEGYHAKALALAREAGQPTAIATGLHNLAIDAFNRNDYSSAERYNREEMRIKRQNGNPAAKLYGEYLEGHIAENQKRYGEAIDTFRRIASESGGDLSLRWQSEVSSAHVNVLRNRPDLAQKDYEEALRTISVGRAGAGRDEFKLTFRAGRNRYYSDYIEFLMQHDRALEALNVAESSRAQVLSDRLGLRIQGGLTLARMQADAGAIQSVVLSYWLTPESSYLWVITPKAFVSITLPSSTYISQLVGQHWRSITAATHQVDTRLYETLIAPASKYIQPGSRVVVIPDAELSQINFETLLVPGETAPHYWIEDVVLSTATSVSLLQQRKRSSGSGNILLIGDPVSTDPQFPPLPHAATELHSIAERFPPQSRMLFEGPGARPSSYGQANPGNYSWIHFAAHGIASKESPMESAIVLSNEGDSFKLYARDIARLPLTAHLVTISACYSSGTRTYAGEGVVGLAWAFLLAGAHNVVASLWEANDYYTAQLMDKMYERLKAGDDPAHALRAAKLKLLHSPYICRNPRYWGAFQLYTGY